MKRSILMLVCLAGCGAATTEAPLGGDVGPVPTGVASYTGNLAKTTTTNGSSGGVSYTEVQTTGGLITLNANFDAATLTATVQNPSSDFARSSTQSTATNYNFVEEATYSGTVSGTGSVTGSSFSANLTGNLTQTSQDRLAMPGATPDSFTGSVTGQVSGTNYSAASGLVTLGRSLSGQTVPLFTDLGFSALRN